MYWYPRNPTDYDRDTIGLSLAEHGAYTRLIDYYMMTEQPLPDDDRKLAAILRIGLEEWQNLAGSIRVFFTVKNSRLHQKRCDIELGRQRNIAEISRQNGKKGGRPKLNKNNKLKPNNNPQETQVVSQAATQEKPQTNKQTNIQIDRKKESGLSSPLADDAPDDLDIPVALDRSTEGEAVMAYNALAEHIGLPLCQKLTTARRAKLRARLADCGGLDGWNAALEKIKFIPGLHGGHGGNGHEGWRCNIDFLLTESRFTKLMEGAYDHWGKGGGLTGFAAVAAELEGRK